MLCNNVEFLPNRRQRAIQEAKAASAAAANRDKKGSSYQRIEFNFPDPEFGGFRPVSQSHQYPSARSVHCSVKVSAHQSGPWSVD